MRSSHSLHRTLFAALMIVALGTGWAWAQTPQTIVIDGVNDFLPGNLVDADADDTQYPNIDLNNVHATNDAVNFYVGFNHDQEGWGTVQLGIAIDVGTAEGGDTDPWGRAIEWSTASLKPDFMFYVNLDSNWQSALRWNGSGWDVIGTAGPGALGWTTGSTFRELSILLSTLGVGANDTINWECWVTQDGSTKGPLDLMFDDALQLSTPGFTLFDTPAPIPLSNLMPYTVQAAADPDPPVVVKVEPTSFPIDSFFDVFFNEPIDPASITNPGAQFTLNGASVTGAVVDGALVHLTLAAALPASASLYQVTVTGVEDLAGNPVTADGVDNTACFGIKHVVFRGLFGPFLGSQGPGPHEFSVEGGKAPLTFDPVYDTGIMVDTGVDDIWEFETLMLYGGDCAAGTASESFEWKFNYNRGTWEPLAGNRVHTLELANGAEDIIEAYWNNEDPSAFTTRAIQVDFTVDMSLSAYLPGDVVGLNGSAPPLNFNVPSETLLTDLGGGLFDVSVVFPTGSTKNVTYKFLLNDVYECDTQGDRNLFLNDELFGDGTNGGDPLVLPAVFFDYCTATWDDVEVVFSVDFNNTAWENVQPTDVVSINGTPNNLEPPTFDWSVPSLTNLADDGVAPDLQAGDKIYTVAVTFPAGSTQNVEYKYLFNDVYECLTQSNRVFSIDPENYDTAGNPQILAVDRFQVCNITGVPELRVAGLRLSQNNPNPFNPATEIAYSVTRGGEGSLRVFNVKGELVRTLRAGRLDAGDHVAVWDGRSDAGRVVGSGVYFYKLQVGADALTRRMILLK